MQSGAGHVDSMRVRSLTKYCVLLACFSSLANAADRIFNGSLERITHTSIAIRLGDRLVVDAALPAAFAVPYHLADRVEIDCTPVKTVYDAPSGLHYHLQLKNLRQLRPASPQEQDAMMESLSWQPGENLLQPARVPAPAAEQSQLDRVREVNLDYVAKLPDFVADETSRRFRSYDLGKPWGLEHTVQDEVTVKDHRVFHRNVHKHASTLSGVLDKPLNFDFGLHLEAVFGPQCASQVEFVGREEVDGLPMLVYLFQIPPGVCFGVAHNGNRQFAAITGRILVDAANLHVLRSEWVGAGFPEKFAVDRFTTTEQWGYATIGGSSYLVPVSSEIVLRMSDGSTERGKTEYKNHRHFEAATSIEFGKDQ